MPANFSHGPRRPQKFITPQPNRAGMDGLAVAPASVGLVLTGFAPTISTPLVATPAKASLTLTGFAPTVATPRRVTPVGASLVLTGFAPTVSTPRVVRPANASLILTGFAPILTITTNVWLTPVAAGLTLTGYAPTVTTEKLAEGGPYVQETGWHRRRPRIPEPIPVHEQIEPTIIQEPEPVLVAMDNRSVIAALYATGVIDDEEFAALIAA